MESPVMTSASSHRLRSAVSACAQPSHSYLNSSYLGTSTKVESHNSGGCLNKFYGSGKSGESSLPNAGKKSHSSTEYSPLHKRYKGCARSGFDHRCGPESDGGEVEASPNRGVLDLIPKQFMNANHFLSRLNHFLDSARVPDYRDEPTTNQSATDTSVKVIHAKTPAKNRKNTDADADADALRRGGKPLNHRRHPCDKLKAKNRARSAEKDLKDFAPPSDDFSTCAAPHPDLPDSIATHHLSRWHPKHLVTTRTARILREIRNVWQSRVGTSKSVPPECVGAPFQDSQLFLAAPKVSAMLEYATECPANTPPITFPEFYRIANDLRKSNEVCEDKRPPPPHRLPDRNEEKRPWESSKGMTKYEVFLGGSCNPTTWRTDLAIPELERMGISYYNPQVEEWGPELMEVEYEAKESATVVFFVLDNQTRGVSALIEVAHLAGNGRNLILVVQSYAHKNQTICDETISEQEYDDLKAGQEVLRDLVERQGIPVFDDIKVALRCTEKILRQKSTVRHLQAPARLDGENPMGPRDAAERPDVESSGEMPATDSCLALKVLTGGMEVSVSGLRNVVVGKAGKELNGSLPDGVGIDSEDLSALMSEMKRQLGEGALPSVGPLAGARCRDVYLGGTTENTSWRESIAVPILEEQNLSFFVPAASEGRDRFAETEAAAMERSFILLFAITSTARSVAAMAIAGHYIGRGANVVLCVEHLPPNASIGEETLTENAVKDYNRGRMYLTDIAERSGVPVFTDIPTAVKFVTQKCINR